METAATTAGGSRSGGAGSSIGERETGRGATASSTVACYFDAIAGFFAGSGSLQAWSCWSWFWGKLRSPTVSSRWESCGCKSKERGLARDRWAAVSLWKREPWTTIGRRRTHTSPAPLELPWALAGLAGLPKPVRCCGWRNWVQVPRALRGQKYQPGG